MSSSRLMRNQVNKTLFINTKNNQSDTPNTITFNFPYTMTFVDGDAIAVMSLFLYRSWPNILQYWNNTTFSYTFNGSGTGTGTIDVTLPDGNYSVDYLNQFLHLQMYENGQYLLDDTNTPVYYMKIEENPVYYKELLTCTPVPDTLPSGWSNPASFALTGLTPQLNFDSSNFYKILGFDKNTSYPASDSLTTVYQTLSPNIPQVDPVISCSLNCNLVNSGSLNTPSVSQSIYQFSPADSVPYGGQIVIEPNNLRFFTLKSGTYNSMIFTFTDENGQPLQMVDPDVVLVCQFK